MFVKRVAFGAMAAVLVAVGTTACSAEGATTTTTDADAAAWTVGQQTGSSPTSFLDDAGELTGAYPELVTALSAAMDIEITQEPQSWENILLSVNSGAYEFAPGADITLARLEIYDYASMQQTAYRLHVAAGNDEIGDSMMDLCGLSIASIVGSSITDTMTAQSETCEEAGEPAIELKNFPDYASADLAVKSGQADASANSLANLAFADTEEPGVWTITGPTFDQKFTGFAVQKGSDYGQMLVDGFNELIASGEYQEIFGSYQMTISEVTESQLVTLDNYESIVGPLASN